MRSTTLLLCLLPIFLLAQHAEDESRLSFDFRVLGWDRIKLQEPLIFEQGSGEKVKITQISNRRRSQTYRYQGINPIRFYQLKSTQDGTPYQKTQAHATLEAGQSKWLLIFVPQKPANTEAPAYRLLTVPDDEQSLPFGSYLLLNHFNETIVGHIGQEEIKVLPGQQQLVRPSGSKSLNFKLYAMRGGEQSPLYSAALPYDAKTRVLMVFAEGKRPGKVTTRIFDERR